MISKLIILTIIAAICIIGSMATYTDPESAWKITEKSLDAAYLNVSQSLQISLNNQGIGNSIIKIAFKAIDAMAYIIIETTKVGARLAIDNPQINFRLIVWLIIITILLMAALPLTQLIVIIGVLIIDIYHHFKEKRDLKKLKNRK
jgi:hypothetical protein